MKIIRDIKEFRKQIKQWDADPNVKEIGHFSFGTFYNFHYGHHKYLEWIRNRCDKLVAQAWPFWESENRFPFMIHPEHLQGVAPDERIQVMAKMYADRSDLQVTDRELEIVDAHFGDMIDVCYAPPVDEVEYNQFVDRTLRDDEFLQWVESTFPKTHWSKVLHVRYSAFRKDKTYHGIGGKVCIYWAIKDVLMKRTTLMIFEWMKGHGWDVENPPRKRVFAPIFREPDGMIPERARPLSDVHQVRLAIHDLLQNWHGTDVAEFTDTFRATIDPMLPDKVRVKDPQLWHIETFQRHSKIRPGEKYIMRVIMFHEETEEVWEDYRYWGLDETVPNDMNTLEPTT